MDKKLVIDKRASGMMSEEEIVDFIKEHSNRFKVLYDLGNRPDDDFVRAYTHFDEHLLPPPVASFNDPKVVQITSNMFRIIEQRECYALQTEMRDRYTKLMRTRKSKASIMSKEYKGKQLFESLQNL